MCGASIRPTTSFAPPAANVTTMVSGRVGQSGAAATTVADMSVATATIILMIGMVTPIKRCHSAFDERERALLSNCLRLCLPTASVLPVRQRLLRGAGIVGTEVSSRLRVCA